MKLQSRILRCFKFRSQMVITGIHINTCIKILNEVIFFLISHFIYVFISLFIYLKILFIYFQTEGKRGRKRGRRTPVCGCLLHAPHAGDLAQNPGMCPDWELNRQPFGLQASAQSTEPHQPGLFIYFFYCCSIIVVPIFLPLLSLPCPT